MPKLDTTNWGGPRKNARDHDLLLCQYCQKRGGTTFTNVKLVDDDPYRNPREIDGIRFPSHPRRLISWSRHREQFFELLSNAQRRRLPVEVIEVATGEMNDRGTVGQVIVGGWLLEQRKVKVRKVLVYDSAAPRLRDFFKQHDVVLWSPEKTDRCPRDAS